MAYLENMKLAVVIYLAVINVVTFAVYGADKLCAIRKMYRVPEKILIGLAALGGSVGAYIGMKTFRHKTKKPKFNIGVPVIFMLQVFVAFLVIGRMR